LKTKKMSTQKVFDTHIHLAVDWKKGGAGLPNGWLPSEPESFQKEWAESDLLAAQAGSDVFTVEGSVFVECSNEPAIAEAKWTLAMADDASSTIKAVIAHIPVPDGKAAVEAFLNELRDEKGGLPPNLKGGRVVLLGNPMPAPTACLAAPYLEGLAALAEAGLIWEWCCMSESIPSITEACSKFPTMTFVLDHLGHNSSGEDFDTWAPAITALAAQTNVVAKLGAIEQWDVADPAKFLDHALKSFGADRVLAESNWFVNTAMGKGYYDSFTNVLEACKRAGYTQEQTDAVFLNNAKRVYSLQ